MSVCVKQSASDRKVIPWPPNQVPIAINQDRRNFFLRSLGVFKKAVHVIMNNTPEIYSIGKFSLVWFILLAVKSNTSKKGGVR